jgi:CPA2 family monovalent cation:H+ antiporter-2
VPQPTTLTAHTIVVGYGRVGRVVADGLLAAHSRFVVIEDADGRVAAARAKGIEVIVGNAASHDVLLLANVTAASCLLIAIPNAFEAGQAIDQTRKLNPTIRIIARAHSEDEEDHLKRLGADTVVMGEREIGLGMLGWLQNTVSGSTEPLHPVEQTSVPQTGVPQTGVPLKPTENILAAMSSEQPPAAAAVDVPVAEVPPEESQMTVALSPDTPEPAIAETAPEVSSPTIEPEAVAEVIEPVEPDLTEAPAELPAVEPEPEPVAEPQPDEPEPAESERAPALAANVEPSNPAQPPAPVETPAPTPIETPSPSTSPGTPPVETPGTDPSPVEVPEPNPQPAPSPEVPGQPPSEAPEPVSPPVEVPDHPVPQEDPTPREAPVIDPSPNEIPADPEGKNIPKETPLTDRAV